MSEPEVKRTLLLAAVAFGAALLFVWIERRVQVDRLITELDDFRSKSPHADFLQWVREHYDELREQYGSD